MFKLFFLVLHFMVYTRRLSFSVLLFWNIVDDDVGKAKKENSTKSFWDFLLFVDVHVCYLISKAEKKT